MSAVLVFCALVAVLLTSSYLYVKSVYKYWERRGVPFEKPTFPFGSFDKMFGSKAPYFEFYKELYDNCAEPILGLVATIGRPMLFVRDPYIARDILNRHFGHFNHRGLHVDENNDPMANTIFLQRGEKWKHYRSLISLAFTSAKLKGMFDTIVNCGASLHKRVDQLVESGEVFEIRDLFARYAINVIASVAFGIDIDCIEHPQSKFRKYGEQAFASNMRTLMRNLIPFMFPKLAKFLRLRFVDEEVGDFMIKTVQKNLEYRKTNGVVRKDFFQLLTQLRNAGEILEDNDNWSAKTSKTEFEMSLEEMSGQAFTFMVGGFETTSNTMAFCIYEMVKSGNAQEKVYDEVMNVLQRYDGKLTYESVGEMKYLGYCIDETLRLHPSIALLSRQCTKEYKMEDLNVVVEEGVNLLISVTGFHYDEKYYKEPYKFIPERFDEKLIADKTFVPYIPFGLGPRHCIGIRYAKLQMKITIASLLQKYRFELGEQHIGKELKYDPKAIIRTVLGGINVKVKLHSSQR